MDWSDLREVYERCGGTEKAAAYYGVSRQAIRTQMQKQGIMPRLRGSHDWPEAVRQKNADARRGRALSADHRARISASLRKILAAPEMREQRRRELLRRFGSMNHGDSGTTPLETILRNALLNYGLSFAPRQPKLGRYVVDVELLQAPVIIEADGAYHALPRGRERDRERDTALRAAGYQVFHFTGAELSRDAYGCVERMARLAGLTVEPFPRVRDDHTPVLTHCDQCGMELWRTPRRMAASVNRFCSHRCQGKYWKTHPQQSPLNTETMQRRWADSEWRVRQLDLFRLGRERRAAQEMVRQSDLHGNMQSQAETT